MSVFLYFLYALGRVAMRFKIQQLSKISILLIPKGKLENKISTFGSDLTVQTAAVTSRDMALRSVEMKNVLSAVSLFAALTVDFINSIFCLQQSLNSCRIETFLQDLLVRTDLLAPNMFFHFILTTVYWTENSGLTTTVAVGKGAL